MGDLSLTWNWDIVLLGLWNRAILTPAGIAQRVFGLQEPGTAVVGADSTKIENAFPLEIQFAIDWNFPPRVAYEGVVVSVFGDRIIFGPKSSKHDSLNIALGYAQNILKSLPETPVSAIGVNLRTSIARSY